MNFSRRDFMKNVGFGVAGLGLGTAAAGKDFSFPVGQGESEKLLLKAPSHPKPAPVGYDRLPLEWYKNTVKRLKEKAAAQGVQVIVIEDSWNTTYFTGNMMTKTERPTWVVLPVDADALRRLNSAGLHIGSKVRIASSSTYDQLVTVEISATGATVTLGPALSRLVFVESAKGSPDREKTVIHG